MGTTVLNDQLCLVEPTSTVIRDLQNSYSYILKERIEEFGADNLMNEELISLLTGISVNVLSKNLQDFGMLDIAKFVDSMEITKTQRQKLELLNLFHKRMISSSYKSKLVLGNSAAVGNFAISLFTNKVYESFYLLCLDSQNRLIKAIEVHKGTLTEAPVYPRLIVEQAILHKANSVILSHNHPGGSINASAPDRDVTMRIKAALDPISIAVVDHVIVAENRYMSFAETGLL